MQCSITYLFTYWTVIVYLVTENVYLTLVDNVRRYITFVPNGNLKILTLTNSFG